MIGNPSPDPTGLPGITREAGVLVEYGDLEMQFGIQSEPIAVFERQRGHRRVRTTFTHEADAERYLLVRGCRRVVTEPWDGGDHHRWPEGVQAVREGLSLTVSWQDDGGEHVMATTMIGEYNAMCRTAWVRDVPVPELLRRAFE